MYSVLAWAAAAGQRRLVPDALVGVNVAALGVLAWLGAVLGRDAGRRPAWGLLIVGYFGFLFSLGRDLTEICEASLVVGALVALRRHHPVVAGAVLAAAVLSRETALDVVAAVATVALVEIVRGRRRPGWLDAAWILPAAVYVAWQLATWTAIGTVPLRADAGDNLTYPFVFMIEATGHFLRLVPSAHSLIWLAELAALAFVTVLAASTLRTARVPVHEKVAWAFALLVVVCLAKGIWYGHADFRGFEDLYVLSSVLLLGSDRRLRIVAAVVVLVWAITFVHRVLFL